MNQLGMNSSWTFFMKGSSRPRPTVSNVHNGIGFDLLYKRVGHHPLSYSSKELLGQISTELATGNYQLNLPLANNSLLLESLDSDAVSF